MKFAFMAQTAYQLMNMIKFVYFDAEGSKGNSVVFINNNVFHNLHNVHSLVDRGYFAEVYTYKGKNYKEEKVLGKIDTIISVMNKKSLEKMLMNQKCIKEAEIVVIPSVSLESQIFWQYIGHSKVYLIEDGLGSLTGDILLDGMSRGRRYLTELLYGRFKLDKMYLNNLRFNNSEAQTHFEQIPGEYEDAFCDFLSELFLPETYHMTFKGANVIYLQQPVSIWNAQYIKVEEELIKKCNDILENDFIVRCHPLTVNNPKIEEVRYDCDNYSWEAICAEQVTQNTVLIGVFSTAQYSPKQIFNKEPFVIFLYKVIRPTNIEEFEIEKMVDKLKDSYRDKNKIYVPETTEELYSVLGDIHKELLAREMRRCDSKSFKIE